MIFLTMLFYRKLNLHYLPLVSKRVDTEFKIRYSKNNWNHIRNYIMIH